MTWKEFKDTIDAAGIPDEAKIHYIDIAPLVRDTAEDLCISFDGYEFCVY